jgi:hypothetical protein
MRSLEAAKPGLDGRGLLLGAVALVVTFSIAGGRAGAHERTTEETEVPETAGTKSVSPDAVQGFLALNPAGWISVYAGKVDLGTGVETALMQIVADELNVPLRNLTLIQGGTALTPESCPSMRCRFGVELTRRRRCGLGWPGRRHDRLCFGPERRDQALRLRRTASRLRGLSAALRPSVRQRCRRRRIVP